MSETGRSHSKGVVKFLTALNVAIYRLSGGRLMNRFEGAPVCLVTMTGRKSGRKKSIALMYTPDGDRVLLVASLGGAPRHPAWYHNLKAHPEIEIQLGSARTAMVAREASSDERRSLWPKVVANYPSFAAYQNKTSREIPIFVCAPKPS
jgi:deazaflavin-dependent oxidoreductase (nitroreductase family)